MSLQGLFPAIMALAATAPCAFAQGSDVAPAARVRGVQAETVADLVVLDGGFNSGMRQGMICQVMRNGVEIAELVLVEIRPAHSTAVLLSVASGRSVRSGDIARVRILKS